MIATTITSFRGLLSFLPLLAHLFHKIQQNERFQQNRNQQFSSVEEYGNARITRLPYPSLVIGAGNGNGRFGKHRIMLKSVRKSGFTLPSERKKSD